MGDRLLLLRSRGGLFTAAPRHAVNTALSPGRERKPRPRAGRFNWNQLLLVVMSSVFPERPTSCVRSQRPSDRASRVALCASASPEAARVMSGE